MLTLIDSLKQVKDFRESKGIRHPLWLVLLLVIMGYMSGYVGYRACGDFVKRHQKEIISSFKLPSPRVPSYGTIRRVIMGVNYEELISAFNNWAGQYLNKSELEWIAVDGKALRNTVNNYEDNCNQSNIFATIISFFSMKKGIVVTVDKFDNLSASEINRVQNLIKALDLKDVVLTLDAIHCQTETVKNILSSGGDFVIPVKENQPLLLKAVDNIANNNIPDSVFVESEKIRDRKTTRTVYVFKKTTGIAQKWSGIKTVIKVERKGKRGIKDYYEVIYYISSLTGEASLFAAGIRGHWGIENRLHYVKDVVFFEDSSPISQTQPATNLSILTTIAINLLRYDGYCSMTKAIRLLGDNWEKLCSIVV